MASKVAELEMNINEHRFVKLFLSFEHEQINWHTYANFLFFYSSLVIDTLQDVDPSRKCYRLVEGILVERTVKEVLPALENNKEEVTTDSRIYCIIKCSMSFSMECNSKYITNVCSKFVIFEFA